jgi:hypothetical protein
VLLEDSGMYDCLGVGGCGDGCTCVVYGAMYVMYEGVCVGRLRRTSDN